MRNLAQRLCNRCGLPGGLSVDHQCLSDGEWEALKVYAKANGRTWRHRLWLEWTNDSEVLRETRNKVGPSGLVKLRPFPLSRTTKMH